MPLSNLPGGWKWVKRGNRWWRINERLDIEDGPHLSLTLRRRCDVCGLRVEVDPYGGSSAWVHLSRRMNKDHQAIPEPVEGET